MKSLVTTLLALGLVMPPAAYALTVDDLIDAAKENGSYSESRASVSSGGQRAEGGESVTTGDVSASSHIETKINANGDGQVKVKIETSQNGTTTTEEYSKPIGNESVKVEASASADEDGASSDVKVDGEKVEPTTTATVTAHVAAAESKIEEFFTEKVPEFFKKFVDFFWW